MLSELVIQGTKKICCTQVQEAAGENSEKIVHTMRQLSGLKTILKSAFVDNSHPTKVIN